MEFPGFLGNKGVKDALRGAYSAGRFPHAVILQGEAGTGKRTLAGLIAQALVCRGEGERPCGQCPSCLRAKAGSHPDIRVTAGSGATGAIGVDAVRQLSADAQRMPEEAGCNIYILDLGGHTLPAAQNTLLKLIEEPPGAAVFILLAPTAEAVLPTIRSRAQIFTLRPPEPEEAAAWLCAHSGAGPEKARELAVLCGGNLGRMQAELEGGEEARAFGIAREMAGAILARGATSCWKAAGPLQKDRALFRQVLDRLEGIFRDACVLRSGGRAVLGGAPEEAEKLCTLPMARLCALPGLIEEYRQKLDRNANMGLLVACFCARLRG